MSNKLLLWASGDYYRMQQLVKFQRTSDYGVSMPSLYMYYIAFTPESQGPSQKRRPKDCKSQKSRESALRVCLFEMTGKLHQGNKNNMAA